MRNRPCPRPSPPALGVIAGLGLLAATCTTVCGQCGDFEPAVVFDHTGAISLRAVDTVGADQFWVAGYRSGPGAVAAFFDGEGWAVHVTPDVDGRDIYLESVSALAADDVWAAGVSQVSGITRAAVLHYDGAAWTGETLPMAHPTDNWVMSIEAIAPDNVWAVGFAGSFDEFLAYHFDGSEWIVVDFPEPPAAVYADFGGVTSTGPDDIWIAATTRIAGDDYESKTFHFDGETWTLIAMPQPGTNPTLYDIDAATPTEAWAVGDKFIDGLGHQPLTYRWDGHSWTEIIAPMPGAGWNFLFGVGVAPNGRAFASGYHYYGAVSEPIAMVFDPDSGTWTGYDLEMVGYSTVAWSADAFNGGDGILAGTIGYYGGEPSDPYVRRFRAGGGDADIDCDGVVDFADLLMLLAAWGPCAECPEDVDDSGVVEFADLLVVLAAWTGN